MAQEGQAEPLALLDAPEDHGVGVERRDQRIAAADGQQEAIAPEREALDGCLVPQHLTDQFVSGQVPDADLADGLAPVALDADPGRQVLAPGIEGQRRDGGGEGEGLAEHVAGGHLPAPDVVVGHGSGQDLTVRAERQHRGFQGRRRDRGDSLAAGGARDANAAIGLDGATGCRPG